MPLLTTRKNMLKVLSYFIEEGEEIKNVVLQGGFSNRATIGETDKQRLIITNFPLFGKPKLIKIIPFSDISLIDFFPLKIAAILVIETKNGERYRWKLQSLPTSDQIGEATKMYNDITEINPNARPGYIQEGEKVIASFKSDEGSVKMTDKNIIILDVNKKTGETKVKAILPITEIKYCDFYFGKMSASFIYLEQSNGNNYLLKIGDVLLGSGIDSAFHAVFSRGSTSVAQNFYDSIKKINSSIKPEYINEGEEILATARVGHTSFSMFGSSFLRLTNQRLLELKPEKSGKLIINQDISLNSIKKIKFIEEEGENTSTYIIKLETDSKKYKFTAQEEYRNTMEYIAEEIHKHIN